MIFPADLSEAIADTPILRCRMLTFAQPPDLAFLTTASGRRQPFGRYQPVPA
jgi:hypothetical protein